MPGGACMPEKDAGLAASKACSCCDVTTFKFCGYRENDEETEASIVRELVA